MSYHLLWANAYSIFQFGCCLNPNRCCIDTTLGRSGYLLSLIFSWSVSSCWTAFSIFLMAVLNKWVVSICFNHSWFHQEKIGEAKERFVYLILSIFFECFNPPASWCLCSCTRRTCLHWWAQEAVFPPFGPSQWSPQLVGLYKGLYYLGKVGIKIQGLLLVFFWHPTFWAIYSHGMPTASWSVKCGGAH